MKYHDMLVTPEGRAKLADVRMMISKLAKDIGVALQPFVEEGEVPGFKIVEFTYRNAPNANKVFKYLKKREIDISKHEDCIKVDVSKLCREVDGLEIEDFMSEGLIEETKAKQIRKKK